jgi:sugar lactone lactonase YvrE
VNEALATERGLGTAEVVHLCGGQMPTGLTVSDDGRTFLCYPRWGDRVDFTVGEIRDGIEVPYPNAEVNRLDLDAPRDRLVSVQSVVIDPAGRLWMLDTGSLDLGAPNPGAAKLVAVDLDRDEIVATIPLPSDVVLQTTYLNDMRFDLRRGEGGLAFISDSGHEGPNGVIVVDLASERSWRKLTGHPSTRPVDGFVAIVEGRPLCLAMKMGCDGVALSPDGQRLYYAALASRRLYSVSTYALAEEAAGDDEVAETIEDLGEKGAADGLESDADGAVYAGNYEQGSVLRALPDQPWEAVVHQPGMLYVDSLYLAGDRHLYFTVNQLHRHPYFQADGRDRRQRPYAVMRTPAGAAPVRLA